MIVPLILAALNFSVIRLHIDYSYYFRKFINCFYGYGTMERSDACALSVYIYTASR